MYYVYAVGKKCGGFRERGIMVRRLVSLIALSCLLAGIFCPGPAFAAEKKMLVRVELGSSSEIATLQKMGLDIASETAKDRLVEVIVTGKELEELRKYGWKTSILTEDLAADFRENINADGNLGGYHTYDEMLQEMRNTAARYPDIVRLIDIGDTWEKTQGIADRDIWALKISDNPDQEEPGEPDVLIMGCHHARELITVEIPLAVIKVLTAGYDNPRIKSLVNNREIWIVPMVNPDGHAYVQNVDPMWRKNRNTNGSSDPAYQGVDLNRNYGYQWGYDDTGSNPFRWGDTYRGLGPFSEPETQAIRDLAETKEFVLSLSYHSYGDLFLFPWGYINADTDNHSQYEQLGNLYTRLNSYVAGNAKDGAIYTTNGGSDDWMHGEQASKNKVLGITVEVGNSFQPPDSSIPTLVMENLRPALWMIAVAQYF
jgi:hypothetical protein